MPAEPAGGFRAVAAGFVQYFLEERFLKGVKLTFIGNQTLRKAALRALFCFAVNAYASPGDGFEAGRCDLVFALHADPVGALVNSMNGFVYSSKEFGVRLF